jgi:hypothetical protein
MPQNYRYYVHRRFPNLGLLIDQRWAENREFRSLCRDYAEAIEALALWETSAESQASLRISEYRRLVRDLEMELLLELHKEPLA